ncbi:CshA/CshB family fibrillar adhesin-related protein [Actinobaculum sp. 352]|uniref:CshA/CshB family fibrillar adhesin-related protein n=1 Tax=Actinobaculum sp. 352 TaxID=2490946 RepID=UPI001F4958FD|nr:CshA/CshB family fibrillar adhesin-related protein [Actinobaculum sp. 352]
MATLFAALMAVTTLSNTANAEQSAQSSGSLDSTALTALPGGALPAVFATGGEGRFKEAIQWLQWADYSLFDANGRPTNDPVQPPADSGAVWTNPDNTTVLRSSGSKTSNTFVNYRDMGDAGQLVTTCTLSNLQQLDEKSGELVATIPGTWAGDALDDIYNIGGAGYFNGEIRYPTNYVNPNTMVTGLANGYAYKGEQGLGHDAKVSFDLSCEARLDAPDGISQEVSLAGLVFADAEASSMSYGDPLSGKPYRDEWVQAAVNGNVTWRVLDTYKSGANGADCPVTTVAAMDSPRSLRFETTGLGAVTEGRECVYNTYNGVAGRYSVPLGNGGPDAVVFMEGATRATITLQGGGYSAVALGFIIAADFGDAPESYGKASALFQPTWTGGAVSRNGQDLFALGKASMGASQTRLGANIDAEGYHQHSDDALGDDANGDPDDEDGVVLPVHGIRVRPGQSFQQSVSCTGPGKVAGWIDWNHNGIFDDGEKSNEVMCRASRVNLLWTVPNDVVRSVDGESGSQGDTYMRVRISNDSAALRPTGNTTTGEVEDYKVAVRVPTLQLIKQVDNTYTGSESTALSATDWTLTGNSGAWSVSGAGTTGDPSVVQPGVYTLSENASSPQAAGYEAGEWACTATDGTQGENYTSWIQASRPGVATLYLRSQDRVTCTIVNVARPGSLVWKKYAADGETQLGGSEWTLTGPGVPNSTTVTDCVADSADSCPSGDYVDTDPAAGAFKIANLHWGTYSIKETEAPAGYQPTSETFTFPTISGSQLEVTLVDSSSDAIANGGVVNTPLTGTVKWSKTDTHGNLLSGSEWTLTGPDVPANTTVVDCIADTAEQCPTGPYTDRDPRAGVFFLEDLAWSSDSYSLVEKTAPAGYRLDAAPHEFMIATDALDYEFSEAFTNKPGKVPGLPLTGGMSTDSFLIGGIALLLVAFGGAVLRRKRGGVAFEG